MNKQQIIAQRYHNDTINLIADKLENGNFSDEFNDKLVELYDPSTVENAKSIFDRVKTLIFKESMMKCKQENFNFLKRNGIIFSIIVIFSKLFFWFYPHLMSNDDYFILTCFAIAITIEFAFTIVIYLNILLDTISNGILCITNEITPYKYFDYILWYWVNILGFIFAHFISIHMNMVICIICIGLWFGTFENKIFYEHTNRISWCLSVIARIAFYYRAFNR
jgi:hypothetical protein